MRMRIPNLLPLLLALLPLALASSGDRHGSYLACHQVCVETCSPSDISLPLRSLAWDCAADCGYECSHALTDLADAGSEYYHQFHGKWAFYRRLLMQEPASVIFSLGNLLVHYKGWLDVTRRVSKTNGLRWWLQFTAIVQVNTWIWSAVFHTRDLPWTERLDYFSATVTIGTTLHYAIIRVFRLQTARGKSALLAPISTLVALIVVGHFAYVSSLEFFPYGYHVAFGAVLGMLGNLIWVMWSVSFVWRPKLGALEWPAPYPFSVSGSNWTPAILVLLTMAAMSLELLDFPPFHRAVDAHALWHLATIPLGMAWWHLLIKDAVALDAAGSNRKE